MERSFLPSTIRTATANDDRGGATANFGCSPTKNTANVEANMAGANPLTKNPIVPTPDIDVKSSIQLTENLKEGTLTVNASMKGGKFPSAEMFIGDTKGQQAMLVTSGYEGSPFVSLPGDNNSAMTVIGVMNASVKLIVRKGRPNKFSVASK